MSNMLDWAKREVEIACKKETQIEKKANLTMDAPAMRVL